MTINIDQNNKSLNVQTKKIKEFLNNQLPFRDKTKPLWKMNIDFSDSDQEVINKFFELIGIDRQTEKKAALYERALRMVLANLILDIDRNYWIVANRSETKYLEHSEKWFRTKYVNHIYDCFLHHGLINQVMGNSLTHEATKILPRIEFQDLIKTFGLKEINIKSSELKESDLVVLDKSKKIGLKEQVKLVKGLNDSLKKLSVRYSLNTSNLYTNNQPTPHKQGKTRNPSISIEDSSIYVNMQNMGYKRVFGETENDHGRIYSEFQNLPKFIRHNLEFFDEQKQEFVKTIELDYSSTHLKMIYDLAKINTTSINDFYLIPEFPEIPRDIWKQISMRVINCTSKEEALGSLRRALNCLELASHPQVTLANLENLLDAFLNFHKAIGHQLFSGNKKLMNLDSKIAIRIIQRFTDEDKPILSIHDSFVVMQEDKEFLYECMTEAWQEVLETEYLPKIKEV